MPGVRYERGGAASPQGETIALTGNGTFGPYSVNTIVKITSDGAYNLAASGTFATWVTVWVMNTSAHSITLTDPNPNQVVPAGNLAVIIFDGSTWR